MFACAPFGFGALISPPNIVVVNGVVVSAFLGTASVSINGSVTVTPIGVSSISYIGSLFIAAAATILPTGTSSTSALGNETVNTQISVAASPTGVNSSSYVGSVTVSIGIPNSAYSATVANVSVITGLRSATVQFNADGTTTNTTIFGSSAGTNWFTTTTTGVGSNYWVRLTTTSSFQTIIGGTITPGTWVSLATAKNVVFTNNNANNEGTGTMSVTFATSSGGANPVSAGNIDWDVGYQP